MAGQKLVWRELRVGILVVTSFILLAVAIFFISGENGFFTPKYNIRAYFQSANGLHAGAAVLLDGVTIGNVSAVQLSPEAEANKAVEATLRLDRRYHDMIRTNAKVSIGTVGLLGDQQIELTRGTTDNPPLPDDGTIQGTEVGDIKKIITGTNDLVANFGDLSDEIVGLTKKLNRGEGTIGALLNDRGLYNKFDAAALEAHNLVKDMRSGNGTVGRLMSDDSLYRSAQARIDRLESTMNKVDATIDKINNGNGTIAKFLNDPALFNNATQLIAKFGIFADRIERGEGTLGKLSKDETLYANMTTTVNRVDKLVTSVENGEGTVGKLMKDSTLYNSLTQTSSEVQKLMYDFRQNPKKYLTISVRLF